jgi:hypothetical protein
MKKTFVTTMALATILMSGVTMAQTVPPTDPNDPGHPRVNKVDQRLQNQQNRVDNGVNTGKIGAKAEERDNARDARVSQQLSKDEAKHNGHVTKKEEAHMDQELNKNSTDIKKQKGKIHQDPPPPVQ